jgi:predicted RNA binding protein YcfA (HicA-like mRNA interferase family)
VRARPDAGLAVADGDARRIADNGDPDTDENAYDAATGSQHLRCNPTSPAVRRARRAALACSGPVALTKRKLIDWLLTHDFEELPRRATSHRRFRGPGTTITVPAHGRLELSAKHTGMLIRELEKAGFDRHQIREELGL